MQPRIEIVPFQLRQLGRILEIERASFGRDAYPEDLFRELYEDCRGLFLVAKRSGRIAGYIVSGREGKEAELISIAVHPDYRSAGVGGALIKATLKQLRRARVKRFGLMVKTSNKRASCVLRAPRVGQGSSGAPVLRGSVRRVAHVLCGF
jgi:ribosomal-protein-alanine N-acetyltransferase